MLDRRTILYIPGMLETTQSMFDPSQHLLGTAGLIINSQPIILITRRDKTMSSLYRRSASPYWWWSSDFKGRRLRKSTRMSQKHLAEKVRTQWDLNLMLGDFSFLNLPGLSPTDIKGYIHYYVGFLTSRKSEASWTTASGVLNRFSQYLKRTGITHLEDIKVQHVDAYLDSMNRAPKTKRNHLIEISLMLDQAVKEELLNRNPAKNATLPKMTTKLRHRQLDDIDLAIIWDGAGPWRLYYAFLLHTGLRAGDVAMLTHGNIDHEQKSLVSLVRKSRRIHEFPISDVLLSQVSRKVAGDIPLFHDLYQSDGRRRNDKLTQPRLHLQALLKSAGRPKATLHSFRVTFNNRLRDLGMSIEDRQVLLAHAASETTKIYTHPNAKLAREFVNKLSDPSHPGAHQLPDNVTVL